MKTFKYNQNITILLLFNLIIIFSLQIKFTTAIRNVIRNSNNIFQQSIDLEDLEELITTDENEISNGKSKQFSMTSSSATANNNDDDVDDDNNDGILNSKRLKINKNKEYDNGVSGMIDSATYVRTSIPVRIFQCMRKLAILRCMKLFLLQKMENHTNFSNSGNLTKDFMEQFFTVDKNYPNLTDKRYKNLSDTELTNRLIYQFQKFFKDRDIKLHFIPGVMVQVIPSTENKIKLSVKKNKNVRITTEKDNDYTDIVTGRRRGSHNDDEVEKLKRRRNKKHNYKHTMIQMAVPVLMMPAILLGTFLPFMLPAFKIATIMSALLNKGALLAALLYAARTSALNNEADVIHYSYNHPGYH